LAHRSPVRVGHAGPIVQWLNTAQFPQRPQGGQGASAKSVDAQQQSAQVYVRQNEPEPDQLPDNDGVHGRRRQRYRL